MFFFTHFCTFFLLSEKCFVTLIIATFFVHFYCWSYYYIVLVVTNNPFMIQRRKHEKAFVVRNIFPYFFYRSLIKCVIFTHKHTKVPKTDKLCVFIPVSLVFKRKNIKSRTIWHFSRNRSTEPFFRKDSLKLN